MKDISLSLSTQGQTEEVLKSLSIVRVLKDFKIEMPGEMITEWVDMIITNAVIVEPEEKLEVVKSDIKDNIIVESAVEGRADYIVSQDNHLLELKEFRNIKIISPENFLNLFFN